MLEHSSEQQSFFRMARRRDHRPFLGFRKELHYGRLPSGDIVPIDAVRRGAACDCTCPACGEALVARQGDVLIHHFAHAGANGDGCGKGLETNAHVWAKRILKDALHIRLPDVKAVIGERARMVKPGRDFHFVEATLEQRLGGITPDVVLIARDGRRLIVEIRVTHACDREKIAKLRAGDISAIEVDLYPLRNSADEDEVRQALLDGAKRSWLYNPAVETAIVDLRREIAAEAARKAAVQRAAAEKAVRRLRAEPVRRPDTLKALRAELVELGLGRLATGLRPDDGFIVPGALWKAAALMRLITEAPPYGACGQVTVERLEGYVQNCLAPEFRYGGRKPVAVSAMVRAVPDFTPPFRTLEMFLELLISDGVLYYRKGDHWLDPAWPERAVALAQERVSNARIARERKARSEDADRLLKGLFDSSGVDPEGPAFSLARWRAAPPDLDGRSIAEVAEDGGEDWRSLRERLSVVGLMLGGGAPCDELMGLPFETHRADAVRQADVVAAEEARLLAEAERHAAESRVQHLRQSANLGLFDQADAWLASAGSGGTSWEKRARESQGGLKQALEALAPVAAAAAAARREKANREALQAELREAALAVYDPSRAELFLRAMHPELGASPLAYCDEPRKLKLCLSLLPTAAKWR
ncbi:hypothetical protein IWC96_05035 [Brevundimonas sp. BAL450]|uniref:competence protein CoiA family protein n=1 Tax=Brevundimonas sp. BAL450 TaxID=1708162 RepID=UPI0018C97943|nr:hypothetical protein [Brevundimonas sp. BAL450]MBG7614645.1 hypothetical protein [Brevundimonas sp. BAL450]